ncbi:hypothetical protein M7I_0650 [Glarea lozoyensis 74030]|uniref:BTB domain-containing protein n=1 Tax=Glarea lozoyensis (strain ATCC 74030 / MF5533) TaxID=1104152 RepID=H0EDK1_GLAL7|nr:hypothetical protein M7I_0650 [Glarea lozoyensis 74030]
MGQQTSREMPPEEVHPKHPTEAEMNGPDFDLNDVVALYASERLDAKTFLVSKEFASRYSPVLSAMINEPFPEKENVPEYWSIIEDKSREGVSQESENLESESQAGDNQVGSNEEGESKRIRHVYILGIAEDVLDILVQWIHTQKIDPDQFKEDNEGFREMEPLIRAWIYGDELRMPAFQNSCMEVMIKVKKESRLVILPDLFDVWEKTRKGSPLRKAYSGIK